MPKTYFNKLNYTLGDEDSAVEFGILSENCRNVIAIAGSGGRVLPLLGKHPEQITCVDILPEQLFITELRVESIKALDYYEFCEFWGYPPFACDPEKRQAIFERLTLSDDARTFLHAFFLRNKWASIILMGKFEQMLITLSKVNRLITGKRARDIFHTDSIDAQNKYYETNFPRKRWKMVLGLLGNSAVLNSILYKGDFPKKNIPGSTFSNYKRIFTSLFSTIPLKQSFFAQLIFWGELKFPEGNLLEARKSCFDAIKSGAQNAKIEYVNGDIIEFIKNESEKVDFVSLSDVPSFFDGEIETSYMQEIHPSLSENAIVVVRGHLRVTHPDISGYEDISNRYRKLIANESSQLWQIAVCRKTGKNANLN